MINIKIIAESIICFCWFFPKNIFSRENFRENDQKYNQTTVEIFDFYTHFFHFRTLFPIFFCGWLCQLFFQCSTPIRTSQCWSFTYSQMNKNRICIHFFVFIFQFYNFHYFLIHFCFFIFVLIFTFVQYVCMRLCVFVCMQCII